MQTFVHVAIHETQDPVRLRAELVRALHARQVPNKFHYDSPKQTVRWLALHEACSPARTDPECTVLYDRAFASVVAPARGASVHLLGLGAGGGQKDTRLLQELQPHAASVDYWPIDSSVPMLLVARRAALSVLSRDRCHPVACDLAIADDLSEYFDQQIPREATRLITFFGLVPNFEPQTVLPRLVPLLRPGDQLLLSANLAPGTDYDAGVRHILPQYDNPWCREWLLTFLLDLGAGRDNGELRFSVEPCRSNPGLLRVEAGFHFHRRARLELDGERIGFEVGERLRLFYSYRYTPELLGEVLGHWGLCQAEAWVTGSGEEGVFRCERTPS